MDWSPQQEAALDAVGRWLRSSEQVFRLFGYAGTGKTELAKDLAGMASGQVLYGAYTGKAAHVMRQRGCSSATTIHRLIYNPKEKGRYRLRQLEQELSESLSGPDASEIARIQKEIEEEREALRRPSFALNLASPVKRASLVVIDECSMIDERMGEDLLSFGTKILVLGDPAQLPPVRGTGYFITGRPDVMLTEIHRQAADNPIIQMATAVRQGKELAEGQYGESRVIDLVDIEPQDALEAGQLLVGTNALRRGTNTRMRELLGFSDVLPEVDDRLVCLRNDHETGLLNGSIWEVRERLPADDSYVGMIIRPEDEGDEIEVVAHTATFHGMKVHLWDQKKAHEFDYGYCLTVHKAQGSQWDDVMVFDQSRKFRNNRREWLYTAITRAAKRLTVVKM